jgi:hypothetical protein
MELLSLHNRYQRPSCHQVVAPTYVVGDRPPPQHGSDTLATIFSLATGAGQAEQQQGRPTIPKVVALIGKGRSPLGSKPAASSMEASRRAVETTSRRCADTP